MQTFLPYPDFKLTFSVLDFRRLGKQRVEAYQILQTLDGRSQAWKNHPAVKMWQGYSQALSNYLSSCIQEWVDRGYKNNMSIPVIENEIKFPNWFGNEDFHASHRSNLLRKNFEWYSQFNWKEKSDMPYIWPI